MIPTLLSLQWGVCVWLNINSALQQQLDHACDILILGGFTGFLRKSLYDSEQGSD